MDVNQVQSDDEPEPKRIKASFSSEDNDDEYEEANETNEPDEEPEMLHKLESVSSGSKYVTGSATKAPLVFGRALGLQLTELQPIQRYIAEKLISDVIYYGRLEKLNVNTTINVNQDWQ